MVKEFQIAVTQKNIDIISNLTNPKSLFNINPYDENTLGSFSTDQVLRQNLISSINTIRTFENFICNLETPEIIVDNSIWQEIIHQEEEEPKLFFNTNNLNFDVEEIDDSCTKPIQISFPWQFIPIKVDDILEVIQFLKSLHSLLTSSTSTITLISLFFIISTLFSQQFGGNRDLPVVVA